MDWDQRESRRVVCTEFPRSLTASFQDEGANSVVIVYIILSLPPLMPLPQGCPFASWVSDVLVVNDLPSVCCASLYRTLCPLRGPHSQLKPANDSRGMGVRETGTRVGFPTAEGNLSAVMYSLKHRACLVSDLLLWSWKQSRPLYHFRDEYICLFICPSPTFHAGNGVGGEESACRRC